ncbi:hypothetical protein J15TS10_49130 [Paenibacillus woosongensis]|uniref:Uncharacterized protein n=1 Tax=Paenibacillus woosongensis TaxID=307580 RepID=A0ABQ4MYT5_9BACL|nr:hypothetical protein J15TS10_49130 [Paenibacillus woosongensis]
MNKYQSLPLLTNGSIFLEQFLGGYPLLRVMLHEYALDPGNVFLENLGVP